jgi:hypothetical protein
MHQAHYIARQTGSSEWVIFNDSQLKAVSPGFNNTHQTAYPDINVIGFTVSMQLISIIRIPLNETDRVVKYMSGTVAFHNGSNKRLIFRLFSSIIALI